MIIPLGQPYFHQELTLVRKNKNGELDIRDILGVAFVPFQGERNE
jgi:protein-L-isoaspartate(D-aspartate) O-methyltransferase